jgi:serine protease Do
LDLAFRVLSSSGMRTNTTLSIALLSLFFGSPLLAQSRTSEALSLAGFSSSLQELSGRISPSVVQISVTGYGIASDAQHRGASTLSRERSMGSGVVVSVDGYIMTNAHVIEGARTIHVKTNRVSTEQTSIFDGKVIGIDRQLDLALLKIDAAGLRALPFGNSINVKQGELVLAFGSPRGMDNSVTMGIVSAVGRQLNEDDPKIFIQTDTAINPGNSGGPLVDMAGRLVGINTFILSESGGSEGIGFAVPSNVVRYVYTSLKQDGHVHRGRIGINARTITPALASAFNLEAENGVLVEDILPGGPAGEAGLEVGDVVLSLGGRSIRNVRDLALQLYEYRIGDTVELQVLRNQRKFMATVTVLENQDDPQRLADLVDPEKALIPRLAILGVTIDDTIREVLPPLRFPDGVLVAAQAGSPRYFGDELQQADIIHAVNGHRITSIEALRSELGRPNRPETFVVQIERQGSLRFLVLETN